MADDGYVTIHRTTDAAQGELLAEMLRRDGIAARFHKVSSTLIGMPAALIEMSVDVPADAEARAREVLHDLEYAAAADAVEAGQAGEQDESEESADPSQTRWRALARAGFTLFLPGTVHLYGGRPWTGVVLALAAVYCVVVLTAVGSGSMAFSAALASLLAIIVLDMIAGVRAASAEIRGPHAPVGRQLAYGVLLVLSAMFVGLAAVPIAAAPGWFRSRMLARFGVTCTPNGILLENRDGDDRDVTFHRVGIVTFETGKDEFHDVATPMGKTFRLGAGMTRRLPIEAAPERLEQCRASNACRLVGDLTLESIERSGPLPIHATSTCTLNWAEGGDIIETQGLLQRDDPSLAGE